MAMGLPWEHFQISIFLQSLHTPIPSIRTSLCAPDEKTEDIIYETRIKKTLKMLRDVGIADQEKAQKQGRDDSIKQFSTQPHPTYLSTLKICRVELCTELFMSLFFSSRCTYELKFAIYYRAASLSFLCSTG